MTRLNVVVLGLSLSSSWGNGHATTFRSLLRALAAIGHDVLFLERDTPWYAAHRDLTSPDFCRLKFYSGLEDLRRMQGVITEADVVIVGSYVPEGIVIGRWVQSVAKGIVAFYDIDTPVTLAKLERGECEYLTPDLIPGYEIYFSFTGGPILDHLMIHYHSPTARALYCSVDPQLYPMLDRIKRWDLSYLGTYSPDRQPALKKLLIEAARRAPHLRFVIAGAQYPADIPWPQNVERIDHVPPSDHPAFYAESRFTLNVTRTDMIRAGHSPSVRLFEAAACGTPIISDVWDGLDALFDPKREIILAQNSDDVLAVLSHSSDAERDLVGLAARQRVLMQHTAAHRAQLLEAVIGSLRSRRVESQFTLEMAK